MKIVITCLIIFSLAYPLASLGDRDVFVPGHHRSDGAFVRPHIKKSPDEIKENNYGPSQNSKELMHPRERDFTRDGNPNYNDKDDDKDRIHDNIDRNQYGRSK